MRFSGIGGQAIMEGVMMRNGNQYAVAVRVPDGSIQVNVHPTKGNNATIQKIPIVRGIYTFFWSLVVGLGSLMESATYFEEDENQKKPEEMTEAEKKQKERKEKAAMGGTLVFSFVIALALFMALPYGISALIGKFITSAALTAFIEGILRVVIFILYIVLIAQTEDIKRTFMYHGAEHKCINCIESGLELNVENVRKSTRLHKRCGTSFLFVVLLISIFIFMFIRMDSHLLQLGVRLLLVPVIAGVSYEFIRLAGRSENKLVNALSMPGLWLQKLTTKEPDDDMIRVGIASVEAVFDWKAFLEGDEDHCSIL